jgi:hypothetical protein
MVDDGNKTFGQFHEQWRGRIETVALLHLLPDCCLDRRMAVAEDYWAIAAEKIYVAFSADIPDIWPLAPAEELRGAGPLKPDVLVAMNSTGDYGTGSAEKIGFVIIASNCDSHLDVALTNMESQAARFRDHRSSRSSLPRRARSHRRSQHANR